MKFTVSEGNLPTWGAGCGVNPADINRDIFEHGREKVDKRIVVPEGMLKAARRAVDCGRMNGAILNEDLNRWLEATLRWLSDELEKMALDADQLSCDTLDEVRRMFLAQEPEIPKEIEDLLYSAPFTPLGEKALIEAFRRGQRSEQKIATEARAEAIRTKDHPSWGTAK